MLGNKRLIMVALIIPILVIFAAGGTYLDQMAEIYHKVKKIEVLSNEMFYLNTKIDKLRELVAPLILRMFSYHKAGNVYEVMYRDVVIWKGHLNSLNITYTVKGVGQVRIAYENGDVVARFEGRPYSYELKSTWDKDTQYFVDSVVSELLDLEDAYNEDEMERNILRSEVKMALYNPMLAFFLASPLISIAAEVLLLKRLGRKILDTYLQALRNPYILLPTIAVYAVFGYLTISFHLGNLLPIHVFTVLFALLAIPSLAAPIIYYYEEIATSPFEVKKVRNLMGRST